MDIRPVRMLVLERRMRVLVTVRNARVGSGFVCMVVVLIVVRVRVRVRHRFVPVHMRMVFGDVQPHPDTHERARRQQQARDSVSQYPDRDRDAGERRNRKECGCARRSERAQRRHEQHQAEAVPDNPDRDRRDCWAGAGERTAEEKTKRKVGAACDHAFERCNLTRILRRHELRQVVVEGPTRTRARDRERAPRNACTTRLPRNEHPATDDHRKTDTDARAESLAERQPCDQRREDHLEVEQQGSRRSRCRSSPATRRNPDSSADRR